MRDTPDASNAALVALPVELMVWLSPAFPVGSFAYSHGLEQAAERGLVADRTSLAAWLRDLIQRGSLRNDLIVLAEAWRAACLGDTTRLLQCNATALALQPSAERYLETAQQGGAFMAAIKAAWPAVTVAMLSQLIGDGDIAYPVAVGATAAGHGIAIGSAALGYGVAFVSNLVGAAIRLSVIGQTDGQRIIAGLMPELAVAARHAAASTLDDLASATFASDLCSLAHETQYSRLFRS